MMQYYKWRGRFTPYAHQKKTSSFLTMHNKCIVLNQIGCVDADTEYLSPTGWVKISEYVSGPVAQYDPDTGNAEFVEPSEYVKKPCLDMIRFKTKYGVDQLLSPEHRVLYVSSTGSRMVDSAANILAAHEATKNGWTGRIITTFNAGREGIALSDAALRLQVAVCADGHFPNGTNRCVVRLKKQRKKDRLRVALMAANVGWKEHDPEYDSAKGFTVFVFQAPLHEKEFGPWAWTATNEQLKVIADELGYWDGSRRKAGATSFSTSSKASADFAQYAYAATGRTANLMCRESRREGHKVEYVVYAREKSALLYVCGTTNKSGTKEKVNTIFPQPSTDGFKYCFMVPSTFLILRRNGCVFATGNTGKSLSALWAADYLMSTKKVKKALIISPLSTLERVWGDEIFTNFTNRKAVVLHGAAERRKKLLNTDADFYIINHDGFGIISPYCQGMFDLMIVDEAAVLRNPSTDRFKYVRKYVDANPDMRVWLMTGTPTPNEPTDAWALGKLIGASQLTGSYTNFRDKVMMKTGQWKWLPRPSSPETVAKILQPSILFTRDECLDLPDTVYSVRKVAHTAEQKTYHSKMMKDLIVEHSQGRITAGNEAIKAQKLVQISCGVAYDTEGKHIELDCGPRVAVVKELIEEIGGKAIVFVPLTGALEMLERELSKSYTVGVVNGEVSANKRNQIFQAFQNESEPRILLAHPATMAHGLTLTAASSVIWYGPITSNEIYTQANGRVERIGKRTVSNVVHIESTPLERRMYERLKNKQQLQGVLLDLIERGVEDEEGS